MGLCNRCVRKGPGYSYIIITSRLLMLYLYQDTEVKNNTKEAKYKINMAHSAVLEQSKQLSLPFPTLEGREIRQDTSRLEAACI